MTDFNLDFYETNAKIGKLVGLVSPGQKTSCASLCWTPLCITVDRFNLLVPTLSHYSSLAWLSVVHKHTVHAKWERNAHALFLKFQTTQRNVLALEF